MVTKGKLCRSAAFTLIELLVSLAIVATILTLAVPRYFGSVTAAQEAVLREDLYVMRNAIDKFYSDQNQYPNLLSDLVTSNYLRAIPVDPMTKSSNSWVVVAPSNGTLGAVYDVHSGAPNQSRDGTWYKNW